MTFSVVVPCEHDLISQNRLNVFGPWPEEVYIGYAYDLFELLCSAKKIAKKKITDQPHLRQHRSFYHRLFEESVRFEAAFARTITQSGIVANPCCAKRFPPGNGWISQGGDCERGAKELIGQLGEVAVLQLFCVFR